MFNVKSGVSVLISASAGLWVIAPLAAGHASDRQSEVQTPTLQTASIAASAQQVSSTPSVTVAVMPLDLSKLSASDFADGELAR